MFRTDDPVEVVEQATRVANSLHGVIQSKRLFTTIQGSDHVRVEGWQLLGSMLGVTAVCVATEPVDGGYKATVEARASDGRVIGRADALCTKHEKRGPWKGADDYARLSMAQTRATSKALKGPLGFVVSLAGYSATPAEEMTFAEPDTPSEPKPASEKQANLISNLCRKHGIVAPDLDVVFAYTVSELTGGKGGSASKVIDKLQADDAEAFVPKLVQAAKAWDAQAEDIPADREGLPDA